MKKSFSLYRSGTRRWDVLARDPARQDHVIDTNEFVVRDRDAMLLADPGGMEVFPAVFSALSEEYDPSEITHIFASHQDPDVISSLSLWLEFNPSLRCYLSWMWTGFVTHFGGTADTFIPMPDEGMSIEIGGLQLQAIPAHFLHSPGCLQLYDPQAKILFTGDVGAALLPATADLFVRDFDAHIRAAEGFHRRWMGSNEAVRDWCERASQMDIDLICPQHGAIYSGPDVERFIGWFSELEVGPARRPPLPSSELSDRIDEKTPSSRQAEMP